MNEAQNAKWVNGLSDQSKDNGTFTAIAIDTLGFDYAEIACVFQNVPANFAALAVQECETSGGTYASITGTVVGTATDIAGSTSALPTAAAGDDKITVFQIDLRGARKRYLKVLATSGDGSGTATELTAVARLSRAKTIPNTAAEAGAAQVLRVS